MHLLLVVLHHILVDAWSMGILARTGPGLSRKGDSGKFVEAAAHSIRRLRRMAAGTVERRASEAGTGYWREQLRGLPALLELPTDRPRPAVQGLEGAIRRVQVGSGLNGRLRQLARERGATLFMVLLAGFQALLSRYSGQRDIVVASPIAGREREELER